MKHHPLPTRTQIVEVRHLFRTGLYEVPAIARKSGVPLRDVFRIGNSLLADLDRSLTLQLQEQ